MKKKPITKYFLKRWEIENFQEQIQKLTRAVEFMRNNSAVIVTVYSAGNDICVGRNDKLWHRIVCEYEGDICKGGPRPHWHSAWRMTEKGFELIWFLDHNWKGWHGQYEKGELRYDEIDKALLKQHSDAMYNHLKNLNLWFPCHIYNDLTGDLYRP